MTVQTDGKRLLVAYFLWFIGGFLGLHHFYLHRTSQCFIYLITFGGYFGFGLFRDLWRLPEYVNDFNMEPDYAKKLKVEMKEQLKPSFSFINLRELCKISIGNIFGYLIMLAIPGEYFNLKENHLRVFSVILVPFACALGVHVVGNVGRHKGKFFGALTGAYLLSPMIYFHGVHSVFWLSLSSKYFFNRTLTWRFGPLRSQYHWTFRLLALIFFLSIFTSLLTSFFIFNCKYEDDFGQKTKCREAVLNFLHSPAVQDFWASMRDLRNYIKIYGVSGLWKEIVGQLDFEGETKALKVLNLTHAATEKDIRASYHKLSRQWHPDRFKDAKKQREAQDTYIQIQKAYETLSRTKTKRLKKNMRSDNSFAST